MENLRQDIKADFERIVRKYNPSKKAFAGGLSDKGGKTKCVNMIML